MAPNGKRKTILVTGVTGMIGRAIVDHLLSRNAYEIRGVVRSRQQARAALSNIADITRMELYEGEYSRMGDREWINATRDCEIVIHAGGLAHQPNAAYQEFEVHNVRATQTLAEAAQLSNVKTMVFFSSSAVYGDGPFQNATETTKLQAKTPYAVSKQTSEMWLQMARPVPRIIMLRPSLVYGEGDKGNMLKLIHEIKGNHYKHIGGGTALKSLIYSGDVADAISLCLDRVPDGVHTFNISNPDPITVHDLAETIAQCLGMPSKIQSLPESLVRIGARMGELFLKDKAPVKVKQLEKLTSSTTLSVDSLVNATGFAPLTTLIEGITSEIRWAEKSNLL